jgi:ABC-type uncharacterized transport system permease subunit
MTDFITGTDGYDAISDGAGVLNWAKDSVVPAVFGDTKCAKCSLIFATAIHAAQVIYLIRRLLTHCRQ